MTGWQKLKMNHLVYEAVYHANKPYYSENDADKQLLDGAIISKKIVDNERYIYLLKLLSGNTDPVVYDFFAKTVGCMKQFRFSSVKSVNKTFESIANSPNKNALDALEAVNLLDHTINAVEQFFNISNERQLPEKMHLVTLVIVLFHDFGKNRDLVDYFNKGGHSFKNHAEASAMIANKMLDMFLASKKQAKKIFTGSVQKTIVETIREHHYKDGVAKNSIFRGILKESDGAAREVEISTLLERA